MVGPILGWVLAVQVAATEIPNRATYDDSLRDAVAAEILRFSFYWGEAWRVSEASRHKLALYDVASPRDSAEQYRILLAWCRMDYPATYNGATLRASAAELKGFSEERGIKSAASMRHACPSWYLGAIDRSDDERAWLDAGLVGRSRDEVRRQRERLILIIDSAHQALPADDWVLGQLIRFLVDQRDFDRATRAIAQCRQVAWWCSMLDGYALSASGKLGEADVAFERASNLMPTETRCRWNDFSSLLDSPGRTEYALLNCLQRDTTNATLWWLADPLFSIDRNERRAEQWTRSMTAALRSAVDRDERFDWREASGADARAEMLKRFGWPSYLYWHGYATDVWRNLTSARWHGAASEPTTTFEYSADRVHLLPTWRAIRDPFRSESNDWQMSDPAGRSAALPFNSLGKRRVVGEQGFVWAGLQDPRMRWWPREHSALAYSLSQLPEGQLAFLRRQDHAVLAAALDLIPTELLRPPSDSVQATMLTTTRPDSIEIVAVRWARIGGVLALHGSVPPRPAIGAIEFPSDGNFPAGRTRFGIEPPPPLSTMRVGETDVSTPIFVAVPAIGAPPADPAGAVASMVSSANVPRGTKVGVYWETYGFQPSDSIETSIWVERYTPQGITRRLGIALRISTDRNTPVVTQWQGTRPARNAFVDTTSVPIVGHSIVIDTSALVPGEYWLDIAVARVGSAPTTRSRRGFVVR